MIKVTEENKLTIDDFDLDEFVGSKSAVKGFLKLLFDKFENCKEEEIYDHEHNEFCFYISHMKLNNIRLLWNHEDVHNYIDGNTCKGRDCYVKFGMNLDGNDLYEWFSYNGALHDYNPLFSEKGKKFMKKYKVSYDHYHSWNIVFYRD